MTVLELIERLQKLPGEAVVVMQDQDGDFWPVAAIASIWVRTCEGRWSTGETRIYYTGAELRDELAIPAIEMLDRI